MTSTLNSQTQDILQYLQSLNAPCVEVRIFRKERYMGRIYTGDTVAGYYDSEHFEQLVTDIAKYDSDSGTTGIFTTIQCLHADAVFRIHNRLKTGIQDRDLTSDNHITHFTHFPIDVDPERLSGISSSDAELDQSKAKAKEIATALADLGIPTHRGLSGNGCHILTPLHPFENTTPNAERFKALGDRVAAHWNTDTTVYNASRVFKLYGTWVRKGDNSEERPHRQASIHLDKTDQRISFDDLESKLNTILPEADPETDTPTHEKSQSKSQSKSRPNAPNISLAEWLKEHGIAHRDGKPYKGGTKYQLDCPFDSTHAAPDACVYENTDGWAFKCSHNSCSGYKWEDFKRKHGIADKPFKAKREASPPAPDNLVSDAPLYAEDEIDVITQSDDPLEFPTELFDIEPFGYYREAHLDRVPMSDAYAFAGLKHVIASILGRKVFIKSDPTIYPNFFSAFIGDSSDSAKGTAFKQARNMMRDCDPNVMPLGALATPEGLVNQLITPVLKEDKEGNEKWTGGFADAIKDQGEIEAIVQAMCEKESVRISGFFGEFGSILKKAGKQNAMGLLELLMQLYDFEDDAVSPTKVSPTVAKFPTFNMAAATDKRLIEGVLKDSYISGGFTNRFEWYLGKAVESKFINDPIDQKSWNKCVEIVGQLRNKFGSGTTQFKVSDKAKQRGQEFTDHFAAHLNSENMSETMMADSLKRARTHVLKNALVFAVITNPSHNTVIGIDHVNKAIRLSEFTTDCAYEIFRDFATTVNKQVEDKIVSLLRKKPNLTLSVIANRTRQDVQTVEKAMDALIRGHVVMMSKGKRKNVYAVIKESAL